MSQKITSQLTILTEVDIANVLDYQRGRLRVSVRDKTMYQKIR